MTNFEWLVKTNKLQNFLAVHASEFLDVTEKYHIPIDDSERNTEYETVIANWLQAEHKGVEYLEKNSVIEVLKQNCDKHPVSSYFRNDLFIDINNLQIKEIEEDE